MIRILLACVVLLSACNKDYSEKDKSKIDETLTNWHQAAAKAEFDNYFGFLTDDAIFMGTDATEHWNKEEFKKFSKPYFDRGRAWNFTALERNIYFDKGSELIWFDELLNTQMKLCRGSGVMVKQGDEWKIKQYVLSMTIPNALSDSIVVIKSNEEDQIIEQLKTK